MGQRHHPRHEKHGENDLDANGEIVTRAVYSSGRIGYRGLQQVE
jgi:hypothetical protein